MMFQNNKKKNFKCPLFEVLFMYCVLAGQKNYIHISMYKNVYIRYNKKPSCKFIVLLIFQYKRMLYSS